MPHLSPMYWLSNLIMMHLLLFLMSMFIYFINQYMNYYYLTYNNKIKLFTNWKWKW